MGDLSPLYAKRQWRWRSLSTIGLETVEMEISLHNRFRDSGDGDLFLQ